VKVGDLVRWCGTKPVSSPGIVLATKPSLAPRHSQARWGEHALAVYAWIPELPEPEWFHQRELEVINESR
jgi:hypothetical protein